MDKNKKDDWQEVAIDDWEEVSNKKTPKSSMAEAAGLGLAQGATFNFADELAGALAASPMGKQESDILMGQGLIEPPSLEQPKTRAQLLDDYRKARDYMRQKTKIAEEEYPMTSLASNVAGGLIVPAGMVKNASKLPLLSKAAVYGAEGAGLGTAIGAGASEADLTKGEDKQFAQDVLDSSEMGGAISLGLPIAGATAISGYKGGKFLAKEAKDFLSKIPLFKDAAMAREYGKKGIDVIGEEAKKEVSKKLLKNSGELAENLSDEGTKLAKQQKEVLETSPEKFNFKNILETLESGAEDLSPVGSLERADKKELARISKDLINKNLDDMTAQEAYSLKKTMQSLRRGKPGGEVPPLKSDVGQKIAQKAEQTIEPELLQKIPKLKEINSTIHKFNNSMEALGLESVNEAFLTMKDTNVLKKKLFNILSKSVEEPKNSVFARDAIEQLETILDVVNPKLKQEALPVLKDLSEQLNLAHKTSKSSGDIVGSFMGLGGRIISMGHMAGRAEAKIGQSIKNNMNSVYSATPDMLKQAANMAFKTSEPIAKEVGNILLKASESSEARRKAMIFTLMQNPAYRDWLGFAKEDGNERGSEE